MKLISLAILLMLMLSGKLYSQEFDPEVEEEEFILVPKNLKWGIHLGGVYASYFNAFSPSGGVVLSWHRNNKRVGVQMELNYSKIFDEFERAFESYIRGVKQGDVSIYTKYKSHTLELPILLVLGKKRTDKAGFNLLAGLGLRYGLGETTYETTTTNYVDGRVKVTQKNEYVNVFDDEYSLLVMGSSIGVTYGKENFCAGLRIEEAFLGDGRWLPGIKLYGMMRFPKDW
jgi:hypothetical protein